MTCSLGPFHCYLRPRYARTRYQRTPPRSPWPRVATPARESPRSSGSTSFNYRSNIYSLTPGRDSVARGRASLFAGMANPRGLNNRGRFFRRVERGRGHSVKKPGKHSRERPQKRSSTKSYQPFNPSRFPSRSGAALVAPRRQKPRNRRRKVEKPADPRQKP